MIDRKYIISQEVLGEFPIFYYPKGLLPHHRMFDSDVQHWFSPSCYFSQTEDALWYDVPQTGATFQADTYWQLKNRVVKYARKIGAQALFSHERPWFAKTITGNQVWFFTTGFARRGNIDNYLITEDKWSFLEYRLKTYNPKETTWSKFKNLIGRKNG